MLRRFDAKFKAMPLILLIVMMMIMMMIALTTCEINAWKFNKDIHVNSQNSMGVFEPTIVGDDIFLNVEFKLVSNDASFTIQVVEHPRASEVNLEERLDTFEFLFKKSDLLNQMESVNITLKYKKGIVNVYPLSYEFRITQKLSLLDGKWENLTQTSYEIPQSIFLEQENSFLLGIFGSKLPETVYLNNPIQVAGPRVIKVDNVQQGKLQISLPDQPLQREPGTIKLYQDNITEIAQKLPNNLDPKVSFSFEMKNVTISQIVLEFESDSELNNPEGIPIICSCSDLNGNLFLLNSKGSDKNTNTYTCSGDISQCSRITLSSAIPIKLAPEEQITFPYYDMDLENAPYVFIEFTDLMPKTTYSLDFIGGSDQQITIFTLGRVATKRYQFSGNTRDVILENLDWYFIMIDMRSSNYMGISLSEPIKTLPLKAYENKVDNMNTQVIAVSTSLIISVVLNCALVVVVCILGIIVLKKRGAPLMKYQEGNQ